MRFTDLYVLKIRLNFFEISNQVLKFEDLIETPVNLFGLPYVCIQEYPDICMRQFSKAISVINHHVSISKYAAYELICYKQTQTIFQLQ